MLELGDFEVVVVVVTITVVVIVVVVKVASESLYFMVTFFPGDSLT